MPFEPTTLSSAARLIAETLRKDYRLDPAPLLRKAGLDPEQLNVAGTRYPQARMGHLWQLAVEATSDQAFGLAVGQLARPTALHAVGFSWLASRTLREALERLCRYHRVISTLPVRAELLATPTGAALALSFEGARHPPAVAVDAFFAAVLQLCRAVAEADFRPLAVSLRRVDPGCAARYVELLGAPVRFAAGTDAMDFLQSTLDSPLRGDNPDVARATDQVTERYLETLDPQQVASEVRRLLVRLLPTGEVDQDRVASQLNRSSSTLQRQLQTEKTSYRQVLDDTRRKLAERYLGEGELPLSEIAYLVGFADQSNFSRAFKRWTGHSPTELSRVLRQQRMQLPG